VVPGRDGHGDRRAKWADATAADRPMITGGGAGDDHEFADGVVVISVRCRGIGDGDDLAARGRRQVVEHRFAYVTHGHACSSAVLFDNLTEFSFP
jgi:hypothetical protein